MSVVTTGGSLSSVPWAGRPASAIVAERNLAIAIVVSILAHAAFFAMPLRHRDGEVSAAAARMAMPLTVRITPAEPPVPEEAVAPAPVKPPSVAKRVPQPHPAPPAAPAARSPETATVAPPAPVAKAAPQFDMSKLIEANRERRRLAEAAMLRQLEAQSGSAGQSEDSGLKRNIESLARSDGTGGVFSITRMGVSTAEFAFNGWTRAGRGRWREYIQVETEPGGDIERAVVRRMIALIREHYSGDFRWESYRLGRTITLSAAPQENEGLEDFLLREFFGTPLARRGQ